jgi:hypothetical protein
MQVSLLVAFAFFAVGAPPPDACAAALPEDLRKAASREFPGGKLPKQSDNLSEDIQYHLDHGGDACLGVSTGSFTGRGKKDYGFLLVDRKEVWLIVATLKGKTWRFEKVWKGSTDYRLRLFVDKAAPGKFEDCCLDGELGPGQVVTFTSDHEVVVTGLTESSDIAFFKTAKGWVHVWLSD